RYMAVLRWSLDERRAIAHRAGGGRRRRFAAMFLDHRMWTVGFGALAFLASIWAFSTLPMTFQPITNTDFSQVKIETVPGSTLAQTTAITRKVADMLAADTAVVDAAFADIQTTSADIFLTLKKSRPMSSVDWERKIAPKFQTIADARVNFQSQSGGGFGRDVIMMFGSDNPELLEQTANKLVGEMAGIKELRAPRVQGDMQRPEIIIKPRLDLAASMGVTTAALSQTIRIATIGEIDQNSAKFSLSDRQIPIRVSISEDSRKDIGTIENMPVPTVNGGSVPLKVVADIEFGAGPTQIRRYNQIRRIVVGADLAPGIVTSQGLAKIKALPTMKAILEGRIQGVQKINAGDSKFQAEMLVNFAIAVASGILLVLAVLTLLYKRIMPPFVNLGSLMLAPLGGALALHIAGQPLSLPVFIGLLMLLGIVAKNSILVIDFALEEMEKGVPKFEAIVDAGHKRAQPIVMTTVAMIAGMVPTALSLSGDGAWRAPMGITVIGGLLLSTVLTLVIVPASFSLAIAIESWVGPRLGRGLLTYKPGDDKRHPGLAHPAE
ncbi:MAG: efflux RND transporter permease subunit, partial [bacterium]|nr:efflux RND transporter permease subunit [bacterium]